MASIGQVVIESTLVADNDKLTLTGNQQAKILFLSCNPENENIKFRWQSSAGDMPLTDTRASSVKGGGGITLNWEAARADQINTNCPLYIDADHEISLSTASTVNLTCIIYQFTEI